MLRLSNRGLIAVLATLALVIAGCGKKEEATALTDTEGLLRYVPADTPYFFGALEPSPDEVFEKFEPMLEEMMGTYGDILDAMADSIEEDSDIEIESEEEREMLLAVLRGMKPLMAPDSYGKAGFSRDSLAVIYGDGMLPVVRVTVADSAALDGWLV